MKFALFLVLLVGVRAQDDATDEEAVGCDPGYEPPQDQSSGEDFRRRLLQDCIECPNGKFSAAGEQCLDCDQGKYSTTLGGEDPDTGVVTPNEKAECVANTCVAGTYFSSGSAAPQECTNCEKGKFQNLDGQLSCNDCDQESELKIAATEGLTTCAASGCVAGSLFTGDATADECTPCPKGEFSTDPFQDACLPCLAGSFADNEGSAACTPNTCAAGTRFSSLPDVAQECTNCLVGEYQSADGQSSCLPCEDGSYADEEGLVACKPYDCEAGCFSLRR
jgi:hypothetical protein